MIFVLLCGYLILSNKTVTEDLTNLLWCKLVLVGTREHLSEEGDDKEEGLRVVFR